MTVLAVTGEQDTSAPAALPWDRAVPGGSFALDGPSGTPAVWGEGSRVLWSEGEPLLFTGPPGVGKTTIIQQLAIARIGLRSEVLGQPVAETEGKVLYIAADRPSQAGRSMHRMVRERDRAALDERLVVWRGPLPFDVGTEPRRLVALARHYGAGTVIVDSLKDIASGIEKSEVGSNVNIALQCLVADGIETAALHHMRKANGENRRPRGLSDVFGSVWLTAGAGSVLFVVGEPGDAIVELHHLKQPAEDCGPLTLVHDHTTGTTTVQDEVNVLDRVKATGRAGLTARSLAAVLFDKATPDRNEVEKARRRLEGLVKSGAVTKRAGQSGGEGGGEAAAYVATEAQTELPL